MRCKVVYPCEYTDSWKKFEETNLPRKNAFQRKLNMKSITHQDYEQAQQVWSRVTPWFEYVTLGNNHDVYLATDVCCWQMYSRPIRNTCLNPTS